MGCLLLTPWRTKRNLKLSFPCTAQHCKVKNEFPWFLDKQQVKQQDAVWGRANCPLIGQKASQLVLKSSGIRSQSERLCGLSSTNSSKTIYNSHVYALIAMTANQEADLCSVLLSKIFFSGLVIGGMTDLQKQRSTLREHIFLLICL